MTATPYDPDGSILREADSADRLGFETITAGTVPEDADPVGYRVYAVAQRTKMILDEIGPADFDESVDPETINTYQQDVIVAYRICERILAATGGDAPVDGVEGVDPDLLAAARVGVAPMADHVDVVLLKRELNISMIRKQRRITESTLRADRDRIQDTRLFDPSAGNEIGGVDHTYYDYHA